jgi:uncharacterized protein (TIGR02996 family)
VGRYRHGDQFWSIEREGHTLVIDGVTETFADTTSLAARERILVNQKLRAGWKLAPVVEAVSADVPLSSGAHNPALEAAILADPGDETAWQVYGDWLLDHHDVRGEYIARKRAVDAAPHDGIAQMQLKDFMERHRRHLENELVGTVKLGWGFPVWYRPDRLTELDHALAGAGRFLDTIDLRFDSCADLVAGMTRLGERAPLALRELALGNYRPSDELVIASLSPLFSILHRLHTLEVRQQLLDISLGPTPLPRLRALTLHTRDIAPLLARSDLAALTFLSLGAPLSAPEIAALSATRFARQLVDLSLPELDSNGVEPLIRAYRSGSFAAVENLYVPFGYGKNREALSAVFPHVR